MESRLKSTGSGAKIFFTESRARSKPIRMMIIATIRPAMYSILPWPKGCSLSLRLPDILKPTSVISDEPASDRLLKASAITAMEPVSAPARYLAANSSAFSAMPTAPQSAPYARRTEGSDVLSRFLMKSFARRRTMFATSLGMVSFHYITFSRPIRPYDAQLC